MTFYDLENLGALAVFDASGISLFDFTGPQLFDGPLNAPSFLLGSFGLTDALTGAPVTLTIGTPGSINPLPGTGDIPEPASWAMLIAGFGLVGAIARRRRSAVVMA